MTWIVILVVVVILAAGFLLDREIYFYEGTHLGPRIQARLYDGWAKKYDEGKRASQLRDAEMLAQPLLEACKAAKVSEPFVLDFAAGTGRLSYALLDQPDFDGHVVAVDLSEGMLAQAAAKLASVSRTGRVELLRHPALPLPFPDAAFDVVCALEVLELFPDMDEPLAELGRVLRPGGVLLTSRGTEESGRRARVKSAEEFVSLLGRMDFEQIHIAKWWKLFDRVIAVKTGSSPAAGAGSLSDVLRCRACGQVRWQKEPGSWMCQHCGNRLSVTNAGIVMN